MSSSTWIGVVIWIIIIICCCSCIRKYCCKGSSNSSSSSSKTYNTTTTASTYPPVVYQAGSSATTRTTTRRNSIEESESDGIYIANITNKTKILTQLRYTIPDGGTAFRDAICQGLYQQITLKAILVQQMREIFKDYKFINIVLTDGEDTSSKMTTDETKQVFAAFNQALPGVCDTFLIGVNLGYKEQREFQEYVNAGSGSVHFHNVNDTTIEKIFEHIQLEIGIVTRTNMIASKDIALISQEKALVYNINVQRYAILFILDMSGSMKGNRWQCVNQAMTKIVNNMASTDIFMCMLFNDKPKFL